jgi:hypothetical protein
MFCSNFQKKSFIFLIPQTFFRNMAMRPNEKVAGSQKEIRKILIHFESNFINEDGIKHEIVGKNGVINNRKSGEK